MSQRIDLNDLPHLGSLFRRFSNGVHLNRADEPALWAELDTQQDAYQSLFGALGYELRLDGRGFAWFHTDDNSSPISIQSRQLALLVMVIFDVQADAGQALARFGDWRIDRKLLTSAVDTHHELLNAEQLDVDALEELLSRAANLGFVRRQQGWWELLPAVCRYLDHLEALAEQTDTRLDDEPFDANIPDHQADDSDNDGNNHDDATPETSS